MKSLEIRLAVSLSLVSFCAFAAKVTPTDYVKCIDISLSADAKAALGDETLTDFPLPVRLSTEIDGFTYSDFNYAGEDIAFADAEGNALCFERDTWDTTSGSLYWVKIPSLTSSTTIKVYCGAPTATVHNPSDVWSKYIVVIHGGSQLANSAAPDLLVTNSNDNTVFFANGGVYGSYAKKNTTSGYGLRVANPAKAECFTVAQRFSCSAWFRPTSDSYSRVLISSESNWSDIGGGFSAMAEGNNSYLSIAINKTHHGTSGKGRTIKNTWNHIAFVYDGEGLASGACNLSSYHNGELVYTTSEAQKANPMVRDCWAFGSTAGGENSYDGGLDEMRVYDGVASATWFACESGFGLNTNWVTASSATMTDPTRIRFLSLPTIEKTADGFRVTVKLTNASAPGRLYAVYGPSYPFAITNLITESAVAGGTYSYTLENVPEDVVCGYGVVGTNLDSPPRAFETLGTSSFINGEVNVVAGAVGDETPPRTPATLIVSRPAGATAGDLVVNYTVVGGTAVAGTHYEPLPGSVTIPSGSASAAIEVLPLFSQTGDHTVTVQLEQGLYKLTDGGKSATAEILGFSAKRGFEKTVVFRASGYAGSEPLTNFPVLVRLSESAINRFRYADCAANGADIRFTDENETMLSHEIDTWNPEGVSLVWVKVPELTPNAKIVMHYCSDTPWTPKATTDTWSDNYVGVWHMNTITDELSPDATGHEFSLTNRKAGVTQISGQLGGALYNNTTPGEVSGGFLSPDYKNHFSKTAFSVSGWFNRMGIRTTAWDRYFSLRSGNSYGFEVEYNKNYTSDSVVHIRGGSNFGSVGPVYLADELSSTWNKYTFVLNGDQCSVYTNGVLSAAVTLSSTVSHPGKGLGVGTVPSKGEPSYCGAIDEVRFTKFVESADWVKAAYDTESSESFLTNTGARNTNRGVVIIFR